MAISFKFIKPAHVANCLLLWDSGKYLHILIAMLHVCMTHIIPSPFFWNLLSDDKWKQDDWMFKKATYFIAVELCISDVTRIKQNGTTRMNYPTLVGLVHLSSLKNKILNPPRKMSNKWWALLAGEVRTNSEATFSNGFLYIVSQLLAKLQKLTFIISV